MHADIVPPFSKVSVIDIRLKLKAENLIQVCRSKIIHVRKVKIENSLYKCLN